jgi:hypothetical protein
MLCDILAEIKYMQDSDISCVIPQHSTWFSLEFPGIFSFQEITEILEHEIRF